MAKQEAEESADEQSYRNSEGNSQTSGRQVQRIRSKKIQQFPSSCSAAQNRSFSLIMKREEDPDNYYSTGHLLYNSCSTMTILLQELLTFLRMMGDGNLTARAFKRLRNVLTLFQEIELDFFKLIRNKIKKHSFILFLFFLVMTLKLIMVQLQCIAAGRETRHKFVKSSIPNFLVPLLMFKAPLEEYENVRVLCQARDSDIIQWAVENDMVEVCRISVEIGNELSKVVGMHIIEAILQDDSGLSYICDSKANQLKELMATWYHLVTFLDVDQDFSPRLLFHVIRCCLLLCNNLGGYDIVRESLPDPITSGSFHPITEKFPVIGSLLQQLLLTIDKIDCSYTASQHIISNGPS